MSQPNRTGLSTATVGALPTREKFEVLALDAGGVIRWDAWEKAMEKWADEIGMLDVRALMQAGQEAWRAVDTVNGSPRNIEDTWWRTFCRYFPSARTLTSQQELLSRIHDEIRWINEEVTCSILDRAASRGKSLVLATNDNSAWLEIAYRRLGLERWFRFNDEDIFASCWMGITKGNPMFFDRVAERLQVEPSEVLFVDDRVRNVNTAFDQGMSAIHVEPSPDGQVYLNHLLQKEFGI